MASNETKMLDDIITSRRAMILGGGALAAGLMLNKPAQAAATVSTYSDTDILNFALNLEYLEANFYYLAAFGTTIDVANAKSTAAGAPVVTLSGTIGTKGTVAVKANSQVPFVNLTVASYAVETAIEEARHVTALLAAITPAKAVVQPSIDLSSVAWNALASAAMIGSSFDPFASDINFLLGAYVFEDVGVTAYHGAAPLLSTATLPNPYLPTAAGILAVEAYHAGLVRTTINNLDSMLTPPGAYIAITTMISALRSKLSLAANSGVNSNKTTTADDFSLAAQTVTLGGASVAASQIVDADPNVVAFSRTTTQVLNIVTGGGGAVTGTKAMGVFFPQGMNGLFV